MDAKYDADTKIADAAREYQMQKANYDMEVNGAVSALYYTCTHIPGILCSMYNCTYMYML